MARDRVIREATASDADAIARVFGQERRERRLTGRGFADDDHVLAVHRVDGHFGAVPKSNFAPCHSHRTAPSNSSPVWSG